MRLARVIILILILSAITFFISPTNWLIISIFITLFSLLTFSIVNLILPKKYAITAFLASFILTTLLALDLFDIINLILTISLIVGILFLIK